MFMCFVRMGGFTGMGMIGLLQMRPIPSHQTKRSWVSRSEGWMRSRSSLSIPSLAVAVMSMGEVKVSIEMK